MGVRDDVEALWRRLEAWAGAYAPAMLSELRVPADDQALRRFETESRCDLPEGLRASLLVHDGEDGPRYSCVWVDGGELLSVETMLDRWRRGLDLAEEPKPDEIAELLAEELIEVEGPVWAVPCHAAWIPFMELNGGDRVWHVDLAPAPGGTPGQVIEVDLECTRWSVCATSFEAFLESYVEALEAGAYGGRDGDGVPTR